MNSSIQSGQLTHVATIPNEPGVRSRLDLKTVYSILVKAHLRHISAQMSGRKQRKGVR